MHDSHEEERARGRGSSARAIAKLLRSPVALARLQEEV